MDWKHAVHWYDSALKMTDYDEGGEFDGIKDEPHYLLLARLAEMYQEGGHSLDADPQKAGECISCSGTPLDNQRPVGDSIMPKVYFTFYVYGKGQHRVCMMQILASE